MSGDNRYRHTIEMPETWQCQNCKTGFRIEPMNLNPLILQIGKKLYTVKAATKVKLCDIIKAADK